MCMWLWSASLLPVSSPCTLSLSLETCFPPPFHSTPHSLVHCFRSAHTLSLPISLSQLSLSLSPALSLSSDIEYNSQTGDQWSGGSNGTSPFIGHKSKAKGGAKGANFIVAAAAAEEEECTITVGWQKCTTFYSQASSSLLPRIVILEYGATWKSVSGFLGARRSFVRSFVAAVRYTQPLLLPPWAGCVWSQGKKLLFITAQSRLRIQFQKERRDELRV